LYVKYNKKGHRQMEHNVLGRECCVCYDNCCNYIVACNTCNAGIVCSDCLKMYFKHGLCVEFKFKCAVCNVFNWKYYSKKTFLEDLEYNRSCLDDTPAMKVYKRNRDLNPTDDDIDAFSYEMTCDLFNTFGYRHDDL